MGLLDALERGLKVATTGVGFEVELELDAGKLVYSVDVAQGQQTRNVVLDAGTGAVVEDVVEPDDHSATVGAVASVGLKEGIQAAARLGRGTPFYAILVRREGALRVYVLQVDSSGKVEKVWVDGATGAATVESASPIRKPTPITRS